MSLQHSSGIRVSKKQPQWKGTINQAEHGKAGSDLGGCLPTAGAQEQWKDQLCLC